MQFEASGLPHMPLETIQFIEKNIDEKTKVFEWGSGRSTSYFGEKVERYISVEHNLQWYNSVSLYVKKINSHNIDVIFVPCERGVQNNQIDYVSFDPEYKCFNFEKYCLSINRYDDCFFDWIFVDGRARTSCFKESMKKVKQGGYILLDDYCFSHNQRPEYNRVIDIVSKGNNEWERLEFIGHVPNVGCLNYSTIFKKP